MMTLALGDDRGKLRREVARGLLRKRVAPGLARIGVRRAVAAGSPASAAS